MRRASREFIDRRQMNPEREPLMVIHGVRQEFHGRDVGNPGQVQSRPWEDSDPLAITSSRVAEYAPDTSCLDSAQRLCAWDPDTVLVTGWLVGEYDRQRDVTWIVPHWWNCRPCEGGYEHVDTHDLGLPGTWEYVCDMNVARFVADPMGQYQSHIPDAMILHQGQFFTTPDRFERRQPLADLALSTIYASVRNSTITIDI